MRPRWYLNHRVGLREGSAATLEPTLDPCLIQPVLRFSRVRMVDVVVVHDHLIDLVLYSSSAVRPLSPRDLAQADSRRLAALRLVAHWEYR